MLQGGQGGQCSLGNLAAGSHVRPLARYQAVLGSPATFAHFQKSAWGCKSVGDRTQTQVDGVGQAALLGLAPVEAADLEKDPREAGRRGSGCSLCSRAPRLMARREASSADSSAVSPPSYRTSGKPRPPTGGSEDGQAIGGTWLLLAPDHLPPPGLAPVRQAAGCQRQRERLASHSPARGSWLPQGLPAQLTKPLVDLLLLGPAGHQVHDGSGSTVGGHLPAAGTGRLPGGVSYWPLPHHN